MCIVAEKWGKKRGESSSYQLYLFYACVIPWWCRYREWALSCLRKENHASVASSSSATFLAKAPILQNLTREQSTSEKSHIPDNDPLSKCLCLWPLQIIKLATTITTWFFFQIPHYFIMDQVWGEQSPFMNFLQFDPYDSQRLEVGHELIHLQIKKQLYTGGQKTQCWFWLHH